MEGRTHTYIAAAGAERRTRSKGEEKKKSVSSLVRRSSFAVSSVQLVVVAHLGSSFSI